MDEKKTKQKKPNEKPLSLHPLTMDEALKRALDVPPLREGDAKRGKAPKAKQT